MQAFTWFRNPSINYKIRNDILAKWIKKEMLAKKQSKLMRDPLREGEITRFVIGQRVMLDESFDYAARAQAKRGTGNFGACVIRVSLPENGDRLVRGSAICSGKMDKKIEEASWQALRGAIEKAPEVQGQQWHAIMMIEGEHQIVSADQSLREVGGDSKGSEKFRLTAIGSGSPTGRRRRSNDVAGPRGSRYATRLRSSATFG